MSVEYQDIIIHGSANMQEDDSSTPQGGVIDLDVKVSFNDRDSGDDTVKIISDNTGDTTQTVTVYGLDDTGALVNDSATLNGTSFVALTGATSFNRMLKVTKGADAAGTCAAVYNTAVRSNTAQGGTVKRVQLDAGASATDNEYLGMMVQVTIDTVVNVREIVAYDGTNKYAYVNMDFSAEPDSDDPFSIFEGVVFDRYSAGYQIAKVVRPFYNCAAEELGGSDKNLYEKVFFYNKNTTTSLTSAQITMPTGASYDPTGLVDFAVATTKDDNGTSTDRVTAPGGLTFNDNDKDVAEGGNLGPEEGQGTWFHLFLQDGEVPQNSWIRPGVKGQTI